MTVAYFVAIALSATLVGCATSPSTPAPVASPAPRAADRGPRFSAGGPDADEVGARAGYPRGDRRTFFSVPYLVGSQSHQDEIFPAHVVHRAATPSPLGRAASEPALRYEYRGQAFGLDDYMARNPATGLLIARDDTILVERAVRRSTSIRPAGSCW